MTWCDEKLNVVVLLMVSIAPLASGQTDCELKKEKDDLKVYTCSSADSKLNVLKAELMLEDTSFKELLDFVNDINNYVNWQYNTKEARILQTSDKAVIYRTVVDAPWPLSNREMILEHSAKFDSVRQILEIGSRTVSYNYPRNEELIRVPLSIAKWNVSSINNSLKIEYTLRIDPGGSVPAWLVNIAMTEGPFNSFIKLKEELKQKRP
jgi:hypothetical protein